jgi:PAS domain S-box-containing protein
VTTQAERILLTRPGKTARLVPETFSVRTRLVVLVVSVILPAAIISLSGAVLTWQSGRAETERALMGRAQMLASSVERELDVSKTALLTLATSPAIKSGDLESFYHQMVDSPKPPGARIGLTNVSGQMLLVTIAPYGDPLQRRGNLTTLSRVFDTGEPVVSDLFVGKLAGTRLVSVDVPVWQDGHVIYDLNMGVTPSVFATAIDQQKLPPLWDAAIIDGAGLFIARSNRTEAAVGHPASAATRRGIAAGEAVFKTTSFEDAPMLAAAASVPGTGWSVIVATRLDLINAALLRSVLLILAGAVALLSMGLLFVSLHARRITRPLNALVDAADAIAHRRPLAPIPVGVREVSQVGAALARTAAALRAREQERDQAEAAKLRGEARLSQVLATTPAGIVEVDRQGVIVYANRAAERVVGAERGGLLGRNWEDPAWQISNHEGEKLSSERWPSRLVLAGQSVLGIELAIGGLDGRRRMLLGDIVPVYDAHGRIEGALAAFQDVTARHAAAQALRESEARFRTIADALPQLVWSTRADGYHDYSNQRFYEYVGAKPGEPDGDGWRKYLHPEDLEPLLLVWRHCLATGEPYALEYRMRHHTGAWRWCLGRAVPMRDEATGAILRWFGSSTDIQEIVEARETLARGRGELERLVAERTVALTEAIDALHMEATQRKEAEEALRQAQKMEAVGQLTGGIAHDFNNMLQAIGGNLDLLRLEIEDGNGQDALRYVDGAGAMVDRAAALTQRLLAFARRQALQPKRVVLHSLIASMAELIQRTVGPAVQVKMDGDAGGWTVSCDPNQLESALLNLAINARDAMPDGGTLTVAIRDTALSAADMAGQDGAQPGEYVELAVTDTGTGMDDVTRARAFEPFFTTKPLGQGTGLGLSQIYGFVRQSGGLVRLDSTPGHGTTVRLYLPRQHDAFEPRRPPRPPAAPAKVAAAAGETVLLVEDESGIRDVAAAQLRALGYAVREAADGNEALRLLRSLGRVDLLVTDVGLPGGLNGRQVADAARELWPALPVLFITGYAGSSLEEELAPGMEVISKPFKLRAFITRVRAILETGQVFS